jgi:hypothetical protein
MTRLYKAPTSPSRAFSRSSSSWSMSLRLRAAMIASALRCRAGSTTAANAPAALDDGHAAQAVAGHAALPETLLDQAALAGEDFGGELAAVLARHQALHRLHHVRGHRAVVLELFGAVVDADAYYQHKCS